MRKTIFAVLLVLCMSIAGLTVASADEMKMHYFLDIPFEGTTVENINDLLLEKECPGFVKNPKVWSGTVESFQFLGYDCYVQFDFHGREDMSRVSISPNAEVWGKGEEYRTLVQGYVQNFIDLDAKLTEMFGEPDARYFRSGNGKYEFPNSSSVFGPKDGVWEEAEMMNVFDSDDWCFRAYSQWGNVVMELWSNAGREYPKGFTCMLHVRYHEKTGENKLKFIEYPGKLK